MTTLEQTIPQNPEPTLPTDKRAAAIKALEANTKDLPQPKASPEKPAEAEPNEPEATGAEAAPDAEEHNVKVPPDVEFKQKLRARLAAAEQKERQLAQQRAEMEAAINRERETIAQERARLQEEARQAAEMRARLDRLRKEDPASFMKEAGWDRGTLKQLLDAELNAGKPETVLQQIAARMERIEQERQQEREEAKRLQAEAERNYQERQRQESVRAQESHFLKLASEQPTLARLVKRSPDLALQMAYAASARIQRENGGKLPDLEDLAVRVEEELSSLRGDDASTEPPTKAAAPTAKKSAVTPKKAATPASAKPIKEMSERERHAAAVAAFAEAFGDDD